MAPNLEGQTPQLFLQGKFSAGIGESPEKLYPFGISFGSNTLHVTFEVYDILVSTIYFGVPSPSLQRGKTVPQKQASAIFVHMCHVPQPHSL